MNDSKNDQEIRRIRDLLKLEESKPHFFAGTTTWMINSDIVHRIHGPAVTNPNGSKEWWVNGLQHRENGPAVEHLNGGEEWFIQGKRHRIGGPAVISSTGEYWIENGKSHRLDGPAVIRKGGRMEWFIEGKLHRTDGPAIITALGEELFYLDGVKYKNSREHYSALKNENEPK